MIGTPPEYWVFSLSANLEAWLSVQVSLTAFIASLYMLFKRSEKCKKSDTEGEAITVTGAGDENNTDICIKIDFYFYEAVQSDK